MLGLPARSTATPSTAHALTQRAGTTAGHFAWTSRRRCACRTCGASSWCVVASARQVSTALRQRPTTPLPSQPGFASESASTRLRAPQRQRSRDPDGIGWVLPMLMCLPHVLLELARASRGRRRRAASRSACSGCRTRASTWRTRSARSSSARSPVSPVLSARASLHACACAHACSSS